MEAADCVKHLSFSGLLEEKQRESPAARRPPVAEASAARSEAVRWNNDYFSLGLKRRRHIVIRYLSGESVGAQDPPPRIHRPPTETHTAWGRTTVQCVRSLFSYLDKLRPPRVDQRC